MQNTINTTPFVDESNTENKLEDWLQRHSINVIKKSPWRDSIIYTLNPCPWDRLHNDGTAYIVLQPTGSVIAGCNHDDCRRLDRTWRSLKLLYEPNGYSKSITPRACSISLAELTDLGNAKRLVARHGQDIRYCHRWRKWMVWDGRRWEIDDTGEVERRAKETVLSFFHDAPYEIGPKTQSQISKHAIRSQNAQRIDAMIKLASSEAGIAIRPQDLDRNDWLFNVQNGTIDLRTGNLMEHSRNDLITKLSPAHYNPLTECPTFINFINIIMDCDVELLDYIQRCWGYSMTASTKERCFFIAHGVGKNGKSTLTGIFRKLFGDYTKNVAASTIMKKDKTGGVNNDVARLQGVRFASVSETEKGQYLDEALIKQMTGGDDVVTARFLYSENFDFQPVHKLWISTNHQPRIKGNDAAIWDRIHLIPFCVRIPEDQVDKDLPVKLVAEMDGILMWLLEGCLKWQNNGLERPPKVRHATESYREEMDSFGRFLEERCILGDNQWEWSNELYEAYTEWCSEQGMQPANKTSFGMTLAERGFKAGRNYRDKVQARTWIGISLNRF